VTQGGPLSAKLFNILVDAVVREWLRLLKEEMEGMMETLFAIFYVDDAYIASRDPVFLQEAIDGLISAFKRVGLETNIKKTQAMTCTPGTIRLQLPTKSYLRMRTGRTPAADWDARTVTCRECGKDMRASSLGRHLADQHQIYQQQVVAEELLNRREGVVYEVPLGYGKLKCSFPLCKGELASGWMMQRHFRDLHPLDYVVVKKEGRYL
jgi:RNase P subunit RPR2